MPTVKDKLEVTEKQATPDMVKTIGQLGKVKRVISLLETRGKKLSKAIKGYVSGEVNEKLVGDKAVIKHNDETLATVTICDGRTSFDLEAFKRDCPGIYNRYARKYVSRGENQVRLNLR